MDGGGEEPVPKLSLVGFNLPWNDFTIFTLYLLSLLYSSKTHNYKWIVYITSLKSEIFKVV